MYGLANDKRPDDSQVVIAGVDYKIGRFDRPYAWYNRRWVRTSIEKAEILAAIKKAEMGVQIVKPRKREIVISKAPRKFCDGCVALDLKTCVLGFEVEPRAGGIGVKPVASCYKPSSIPKFDLAVQKLGLVL